MRGRRRRLTSFPFQETQNGKGDATTLRDFPLGSGGAQRSFSEMMWGRGTPNHAWTTVTAKVLKKGFSQLCSRSFKWRLGRPKSQEITVQGQNICHAGKKHQHFQEDFFGRGQAESFVSADINGLDSLSVQPFVRQLFIDLDHLLLSQWL